MVYREGLLILSLILVVIGAVIGFLPIGEVGIIGTIIFWVGIILFVIWIILFAVQAIQSGK